MPFVSGFLRMRRRPGRPDRPVDPDYGIEGPAGPVDPDYGIEGPDDGGDIHPGHPLPEPPPGIWPPPTISHPIVPVPPGLDLPPGTIWPSPGHPAHPIAPGGRPRPPGRPDQGLPSQPGVPGQGLPPQPGQPLPGQPPEVSHPIVSQKFVVVALIPGYGIKYIVVDPSLRPDQGLPETQPPMPEPRR